jgi:hypothetical protein
VWRIHVLPMFSRQAAEIFGGVVTRDWCRTNRTGKRNASEVPYCIRQLLFCALSCEGAPTSFSASSLGSAPWQLNYPGNGSISRGTNGIAPHASPHLFSTPCARERSDKEILP